MCQHGVAEKHRRPVHTSRNQPRSGIGGLTAMSWKAVDWATDSHVGSSAAKFILILLANKADENFSCYPSIRTLMAESGASRSTVLRALRELETRGFITRRPQFHDSGARRSTRYYLNHPQAPHISPGPDMTPPGPDMTPSPSGSDIRPSQCDTGPVRQRDGDGVTVTPPGVPNPDPLNPSLEPPSEPGQDAAHVLAAVSATWKLNTRDTHGLLPAVTTALELGWRAPALAEHLTRHVEGARDPRRVLVRRLASLPVQRDPPAVAVPWCGGCEDAYSRTITVTLADGTEAAQFCPQCSPQFHRKLPVFLDPSTH
jgi:Helix-turn-helix domain